MYDDVAFARGWKRGGNGLKERPQKTAARGPGYGAATAGTELAKGAYVDYNMTHIPDTSSTRTFYDTSERDSYLSALQAQMSAQQAAYDNMLSLARQQYGEQQKQLALERENMKRNAYVASQVAETNLPLELAAGGINGGLAETSRVKLKTALGRSLADADLLYNDKVGDAYQNYLKAKAGAQSGLGNLAASFAGAAARAPKPRKVTQTIPGNGYKNALFNTMDKLISAGMTEQQALDYIKGRGY